MIYGIDYLGGAKYPDVVLRGHPKGFAAGFFAQEFGDAFSLIKRLAEGDKCPVIRIQVTWAGSGHNYTEKHLQQAIKEAKRYDKLKTQARIQLSPFCEHTLKSPDAWLDKIQQAAPSCTIINNPQNGIGSFSKKYQNEIHTGRPPTGAYNFSYDGQSACDADTEADKAKYKDASIFFFWTWQLNCHFNAKDTTRNTKPSVELIKGLANLANPRGKCSIAKNTLWKSFAEQSDPKGDWRSNKPLCIYPGKVNALSLYKDGKLIGTLPRYKEPFIDGRYRFYLGQWGYSVATEPVELKDGNKVIGKVNPGFRFGGFK